MGSAPVQIVGVTRGGPTVEESARKSADTRTGVEQAAGLQGRGRKQRSHEPGHGRGRHELAQGGFPFQGEAPRNLPA
jgi:hypothetical protein